ncbi:MAG: hypothetical protein LBB72_07810 [Spirochaetaceae bacterium]|jgi:hypothetical protein|nr:hypothetical protein [Spirochaetaceae bacterium]
MTGKGTKAFVGVIIEETSMAGYKPEVMRFLPEKIQSFYKLYKRHTRLCLIGRAGPKIEIDSPKGVPIVELNPLDTEPPHIPWHPAFVEALQMELQDYEDVLEFHPEFQLTSEPLRIDCVVIKKAKNVVIKKNIAVIFREWNLLEYKSPDDYVSVDDFYKVYAYACLYASFNNIPITSLTVSFVENHYPQKLLSHLKNERRYKVAETSPGIYTVSGDILPIQVINSRKLPAEENLWLKNLNNEHNRFTIDRVSNEIDKQGKAARLAAYLYTILTANFAVAKEAIKMNDTFERFMEETGLAAKAEARGEARGLEKVARNALVQGASPEFVQKITGLDIQTIISYKCFT